jgi:phosphomannomutase
LNSDVNAPDGQMIEGVRWEFLKQKIIEHYQAEEDIRKTTEIDGVRLDCKDYWILIRPSGTTPLVRITVESRTDIDHATHVLAKAEEFVTAILNE